MKLNIVPKNKDNSTEKFHEEKISKVFYLNEKRIPFVHQKTPANCGPLSIVNGISALKGVNDKFDLSKDTKFPQTSEGIRKLLGDDYVLRTTVFGSYPSEEIKKDDYVLEGGHVINLIKRIVSESNLMIIGDRFSGSVPVPDFKFKEIINNSDWLICNKNFHYISFVKLDNNDWILLDSMSDQPSVINQQFIEDNYFQKGNMNPFISMKVKDKIVIIKK